MRVVVTGANGMLGKDVVIGLKRRGWSVVPLPHQKLDISNYQHVESMFSTSKPDLVINCAAYTDVDGAETNRQVALCINGLGVRNLSLVCAAIDRPLVHLSTDYVFDGGKQTPYTIYDQPHPINTYGESKLLGEQYLLCLLHRFYLVRTSWLFGFHGNNFVETILKAADEQDEIRVVADQHGAPTFTQDLAKAIADLVTTGCYGIYHITNQGYVSWFEFASMIVKKAQKSMRVIPVTSADIKRSAQRLKNSALDPFPLAETIGYLLPPWENALQRYLSQREVTAT